MSILSPVAAQIQSLAKKLSDSALAQALQMHADPSDPKGFWLAQEAMGRSAARKEAQAASANSPTVVQQLAQQLNPPPPQAMPPQMPPQGVATAMPPQAMPPQAMPPQMPVASMPPQAPPVAMAQAGGHVHDYGVASLPYTPRYEHGGIVSFNGEEQSYVNSIDYLKDGYPELDTSLRNKEIDQEVDAMFGETPEKIPAPIAEGETTSISEKTPLQNYFNTKNDKYLWQAILGPQTDPNAWENYLKTKKDSDLLAATKNYLAYGNPVVSEKPQLQSEETKPAAPFNPNWLMSATAAPSLIQQPSEQAAPEPVPTAPRRIVEVTGQPGGIPSYAGLPALNTDPGKPPSPADFPLDETTGKPKPFSMEDEAERKKIQNELSIREGYNPNLTTEFLAENQKDIEDLKKEEGTRALRDVFRAMTQGFGSTGSFAQGLGAFGQAISKNFDESEKVIDAKKTAFKKYNKELRLAQNDLARGEVDKGMGRYQKAEDAMQAFEQRLADNKNKYMIEQYSQGRQDYRSRLEQAAANQRTSIMEAGDTARAEIAARNEERKAEATRAAARQDKLTSFLTSGLIGQDTLLNKISEAQANVGRFDIAQYISQTQGIPIEQIDVEKITKDDIARYAPIIAQETVLAQMEKAINLSGRQKLGLATLFNLGGSGTGYTATPVQP